MFLIMFFTGWTISWALAAYGELVYILMEELEELKQFHILRNDCRIISLVLLFFIDLPKITQPTNSRAQAKTRVSLL